MSQTKNSCTAYTACLKHIKDGFPGPLLNRRSRRSSIHTYSQLHFVFQNHFTTWCTRHRLGPSSGIWHFSRERLCTIALLSSVLPDRLAVTISAERRRFCSFLMPTWRVFTTQSTLWFGSKYPRLRSRGIQTFQRFQSLHFPKDR
jgi:hypothetical protein